MCRMGNVTISFPELNQFVYPALMGLVFNELDNNMEHFCEVVKHLRSPPCFWVLL